MLGSIAETEAEPTSIAGSIFKQAGTICGKLGIPVVPVIAAVKGAASILGGETPSAQPYTIVRRQNPATGLPYWYYGCGATLRSCLERADGPIHV
jgi:hypothetical protein